MFAIPVAITSFSVCVKRYPAWAKGLRPMVSGNHSAAYPRLSRRLANSPAWEAVIISVKYQMPIFPSSIILPFVPAAASPAVD